jgi:hypothetical protein
MKEINAFTSIEEFAMSFKDESEYREWLSETLDKLSWDIQKPDFNFAYLFMVLGKLIRCTQIRVEAQESINH